MKKLWGASTVRVYGGGGSTDDGRFLENTSAALGDHWEMSQTVSTHSTGRSSSQQRQKIRTLPADALEAMPAGRAVLRAAKCPPALIEKMSWYTGAFARAAADARASAGQDPALHLGADDPDPTDATSLLPSPTKRPGAVPRPAAVVVS